MEHHFSGENLAILSVLMAAGLWLVNGGSMTTPCSSVAASSEHSGMSSPGEPTVPEPAPLMAQEKFFADVVQRLEAMSAAQEAMKERIEDVSTETAASRMMSGMATSENAQTNALRWRGFGPGSRISARSLPTIGPTGRS